MTEAAHAQPGAVRIAKVLVTTDLSPLAERAIPYAYSAVANGGSVVLLHVVHIGEPAATPNPLYAHYTPGPAPSREERQKLAADLTEKLRGLVPATAAERGIGTTIDVVEDRSPADAILAAASRHHAQVVCIATHGRTGLSKLLLGSVAQEVLRRSTKPLLIVPAR